jgi:predicted dehydrogenase
MSDAVQTVRDGAGTAGTGGRGPADGRAGAPIGVAVVGCGSIARSHFAGWRRLVEAGQARLVAACDNDPDRAAAAAREYGAETAATDFEALVRRPEVQAIDVCLPHHLHLPAILAAARAGKHVLCEKPLVLTLEEAATAIRACHEAGVVLMTANRDRFEPHARVVRQIVASGLLGTVNLVLERHMLHKNVLVQGANNNMGWKLGKATSGGGALHRDGVYYLDSLLFWAGSDVAHVTGAEFDNFLWQTEEIETTSHVLFRFTSGAIGVFEMVWCLQGPHIREVTINGSEGYLRLTGAIGDDATVTVHSTRLARQVLGDERVARAFEECAFQRPEAAHPDRVGEALVLRVPYAAGFHAQEVEFLAAIREGREAESSGVDGARALEVVEAAYRAARERRAIDLPLTAWNPGTGSGRRGAAARVAVG